MTSLSLLHPFWTALQGLAHRCVSLLRRNQYDTCHLRKEEVFGNKYDTCHLGDLGIRPMGGLGAAARPGCRRWIRWRGDYARNRIRVMLAGLAGCRLRCARCG